MRGGGVVTSGKGKACPEKERGSFTPEPSGWLKKKGGREKRKKKKKKLI